MPVLVPDSELDKATAIVASNEETDDFGVEAEVAYRRALAALGDGEPEGKNQRAQLERKLKMLGMGASAR